MCLLFFFAYMNDDAIILHHVLLFLLVKQNWLFDPIVRHMTTDLVCFLSLRTRAIPVCRPKVGLGGATFVVPTVSTPQK